MTLPALAAAGGLSYGSPFQTGAVNATQLSEISGIYPAGKDPCRLFAVNDSGNAAELYVLNLDGTLVARYRVQGARNTDWEDLAGFTGPDGEDYLIIGDVGDNLSRREHCTLYIVKAPDPDTDKTASLPVLRQIRFRYPDGPRDCESVAADIRAGRILVLSKRERCPVLYDLPLFPEGGETVITARPVTTLRTLPQPTPEDLCQKYGKYRAWPTAMDLSSDGLTLVILTYKNIYMFKRAPAQTWDRAFQTPPAVIALPGDDKLTQRESLCMIQDTGRIFVTTEKLPAPIFALDPL